MRPHGWAGGPTAGTNLALLAKRPHQFKTDGAWPAAINARRDLTVTLVLGQVTTTRVHDDRPYLPTRFPEDSPPDGTQPTDSSTPRSSSGGRGPTTASR